MQSSRPDLAMYKENENMNKKIILCLFPILLAGCASTDDTVFREKIVPDFEQVIKGDNDVFKAYEEAIAAADTYAAEPTDENLAALAELAAESDRLAEENGQIVSGMSDDEYEIMDALGFPSTDYKYLFDAQASSMAELSDWSAVVEQIRSGADAGTLEYNITLQELQLELERVYVIYGAMDMVVDTSEDNAEYFRDMLYKYEYIFPEDFEWLTDHDAISDEYNARMDDIASDLYSAQAGANALPQ